MVSDEQLISSGQPAASRDNPPQGGVAGRSGRLEPRPPIADSVEMELGTQWLRPVRVFTVATGLGIFSTLQAYNYVSLFTDRQRPLHFLLALNVTYWYAWAILVPGILWMAR